MDGFVYVIDHSSVSEPEAKRVIVVEKAMA